MIEAAKKKGRPVGKLPALSAFALAIVGVFAVALTLPATAASWASGPLEATSLRCIQFAMVRRHLHNAAGWPEDCGFTALPPLNHEAR